MLLHRLCIIMLSVSTSQIYAEQSYGNPGDPVVAEVLGIQIRTKNPIEMQSVINKNLFQKYALQNKIEASQKDIDLYITRMDQSMLEDRKKKDTRRVQIQQQLKTGSLSEEQEKQLQSELTTLEKLHQFDLQEDNEKKQDPKATHKAMQPIAKAIIEQWMINKALYKQYGGRIIAQQMGPEALDAIHKYLQEQQKKGQFKIIDKHFETVFWEYFTSDKKHSFYKQGSKEEQQAFDKPFWLHKQSE